MKCSAKFETQAPFPSLRATLALCALLAGTVAAVPLLGGSAHSPFPSERRAEFHNHAQVHKDTEQRKGRAHGSKQLCGRLLPTLEPRGAVLVNVRSEPEKVVGDSGCASPFVRLTPIENALKAGL